MMTRSLSTAERLLPWVVGSLFAFPVLVAAYPPMSDLPLHEASVGLLKHWGDARFTPPTLYALNLGHANQLFSFAVLALSFVMPMAWACKVVIAASLLALSLGAAHFADHVAAPRWTTLVVAPIGIGWLFFWGLVQNIIGLAALLWLLPAIDRFALRPTARGAAAMCGAMVFLHFAHQAMQLTACLALGLCAVGCVWTARSALLRALPIVFCVALAWGANRYAWSVSGPRHTNVPLFVYYGLAHKLEGISGVLFGGHAAWVRGAILLLALAAIALVAVSPRAEAPRPTRSWGARVHVFRFELLGLALAVVYLVAPANVQSTTLVYHRFLPPAWAILAICAGSGRTIARPLAKWACAVVPVACSPESKFIRERRSGGGFLSTTDSVS